MASEIEHMTLAEALTYLKPDPANKGTISLKAPKAREAVEVFEAAIAALRSKDREDGAREMRERAKLACLDYAEACLDRGIGLLHEHDLPRTGDAIGWADAANGCARLVEALPLSPVRTGDGDA